MPASLRLIFIIFYGPMWASVPTSLYKMVQKAKPFPKLRIANYELRIFSDTLNYCLSEKEKPQLLLRLVVVFLLLSLCHCTDLHHEVAYLCAEFRSTVHDKLTASCGVEHVCCLHKNAESTVK